MRLVRNTYREGGVNLKRRILIFLIVALIFASMPIYALANTSRIIVATPTLSFTGTTANCALHVTANYLSDEIDAVIKLWDGSTCLKTWTVTGTGFLVFSDSYKVTWNREYTLTADVEINDISRPQISITKKCQ